MVVCDTDVRQVVCTAGHFIEAFVGSRPPSRRPVYHSQHLSGISTTATGRPAIGV